MASELSPLRNDCIQLDGQIRQPPLLIILLAYASCTTLIPSQNEKVNGTTTGSQSRTNATIQ